MSTLTVSVAPAIAKARKSGLAAAGKNVVRFIVAEWRTRQAARRVEALSDLGLHDIGLSRSDIDRAVRFGR